MIDYEKVRPRVTELLVLLREERKKYLRENMVFFTVFAPVAAAIFAGLGAITYDESFWFFFLVGSFVFGLIAFLFLFIAYPPAVTWRTKWRALKRAERNLQAVNKMLRKDTDFVLYLYDFKAGEEIESVSSPVPAPFVGGYPDVHFYGNRRRSQIVKHLKNKVPVLFLHNVIDRVTKNEGIAVPATDDEWFDTFAILSRKAKYIVIDYRNSFYHSTNVRDEIQFLIKQPHQNCLFVGSEEEYSMLVTEFPKMADRIKGKFSTRGENYSVFSEPLYLSESHPLIMEIRRGYGRDPWSGSYHPDE